MAPGPDRPDLRARDDRAVARDPDPDPPRDRRLDRAGRRRPLGLWPYLVAILVLSVFRFGANFTRRYATARVGIRVEARMRELLYQAYLRFPRAFYDQHATGQVVSRATNDLYPIRYFIGWGMVQGAQSLMMIVGVAVVLVLVNPRSPVSRCSRCRSSACSRGCSRRIVMPVSRLVQQLKANVTEAADESVVGIEMVQAFGREDDVRSRFGVKARAVRDGVLRQARIEGTFLPGLLFLPTIVDRASCSASAATTSSRAT